MFNHSQDMAHQSISAVDHPMQTGNIWPPPSPDETTSERAHRIEQEIEAKKVSDAIDQAIDLERVEWRRRQADTKILLLGQAESGKSTILKNFQLLFAPKSFYAEVEVWKAVIHLNLVRSVNFVLDLLEGPRTRPSTIGHHRSSSAAASHEQTSNNLRFLKMRLAPLRQVEQILSRHFCAETGTPGTYQKDRASEVSVRGLSGWKTLLKHRRNPAVSDDLEDLQQVIEACRDDMALLWEDSEVQAGLKKHNVQLQDQSGFFLSDVSRIACKEYVPTPDDILRARLQTIGVEEHRIVMETEAEYGKEWLLYDVSGSKGQRAAWAPFLDDVDVVIFIAPISVFNQCLAEDKNINRLSDCFELWKKICGNKSLASAQFILLLNKTDILDLKLKAGALFSKYVTSYKGQPNDLRNISQYLKTKYVSMFHQLSPNTFKPRKLYTHLTCATDTKTTSVVLRGIRDVILINHLTSSRMI